MITKVGSDRYNSYYSFLNVDHLGKLSMVYRSQISSAIIHPVLLESYLEEQSTYNPGYLDINGNFYSCPICIFFIQINKIIQYPNVRTNIEIQANIYNKDFSHYRTEVIKVKAHSSQIPRILNAINIFIDRDNQLENLDIKNVYPIRRYDTEKIVISGIDHLKLNFFENSRYVPRKDNVFWVEVEVRNIPSDRYLSKLIISSLKKQSEKLEITDYGLLMIFETGRWALPDYERRQLEDTSDISEQSAYIKGRLLIQMIANYDQDDHICYMMSV